MGNCRFVFGIVLIIVLCVSWTESTGCLDCRTVKCPKPFISLAVCPYGIDWTGVCNCCGKCMKGPGESCKGMFDLAGLCAKGLECEGNDASTSGRCRIVKPCFFRPRCPWEPCPSSPTCPRGAGMNKCSCCPTCLGGAGDKCGHRNGAFTPCGPKLRCIGEQIVNGRYQHGTCAKLTVRCHRLEDCSVVTCRPPRFCRHGIGKSKCNCCPGCLKGLGESCFDRNSAFHPCAPGLRCLGGFATIGKCVKNLHNECYTSLSCRSVGRCRRPSCRGRGIGKSRCSCCESCLRGPGESCGNRHYRYTPCDLGLKCVGEKFVNGKYTHGKCVKFEMCYKKKIVTRYDCPPIPTRCAYSVGRSRCGGCIRCLMGPREKCGERHSSYMPCGHGLKCAGETFIHKYSAGRCVGKQFALCLRRVDCNRVYCGKPPRSCTNGVGKSKCACCLSCLMGENEQCGEIQPYQIPCGAGLKCVGERLRNGQYNAGICRIDRSPKCYFKLNCLYCPPKLPANCQFGIGRSSCNCCLGCLKGKDEPCGNAHAEYFPCQEGLTCVNEGIRNGGYSPGKCRPARLCPKHIDCRGVICPQLKCRYGSVKPTCGCCSVCKIGGGRRCGFRRGDCREKYYCRGERFVRSRNGHYLTFIDGICTKESTICPCPVSCGRRRCSRIYDCYYGASRPICGCCDKCRLAQNAACGHRLGNCRAGYYCKGQNVTLSRNSRQCFFKPGRCTKIDASQLASIHQPIPRPSRLALANQPPYQPLWMRPSPTCPYRLDCRTVHCDVPHHCPYGYGKSPCHCCKVCYQEPGAFCGRFKTPCGVGLHCDDEISIYGYYRPGICTSNRPSSCPNCSTITCPWPKKLCKYGEGMDPCGCCAVCLKGPGYVCGGRYNWQGHCGKRLYCKTRRAEVAGVCQHRPGQLNYY